MKCLPMALTSTQRTLGLILLLALLCTSACQRAISAPPPPSADSTTEPESPQTPAPPIDTMPSDAAAVPSSSGQKALLLQISNPTDSPRYLYEPGLGPRLRCSLERPEQEPEECYLEDLFCLEPCPSDDSKPLSKRCSKPSDKYRPIPAGEHFELSWDRKLRHIVERQGVRCFELHAPPTDATLLITVGHYGQLDPTPPAEVLYPVIAKPLDMARWVSLQLGHEERSQDTVTLPLD